MKNGISIAEKNGTNKCQTELSSASFILTTYSEDKPEELLSCLESICGQTLQPNELIIVRGQNLPEELKDVIEDISTVAPFPVRDIAIKEQGRGHARKIAVEMSTSELVAVIDADDVACSCRLSKQVAFFHENPNVDAVGGYIAEFDTLSSEIKNVREVPTNASDIRRMAYYRSPMNHPSVTFRRQAILDVGNYHEMEYGEDYELWCRMLENDKVLANIPEILVKVRADGLISRRQGFNIARKEIQLQRAIVETEFYSWPIALMNLLFRIPLRFLPKKPLQLLYRYIFRVRKGSIFK